ncbi:unnamed protein product [Meloidogyne enterolobii]|uniref:Uncharacterized protein n=1 Tax=Meloidogyne enterolobii TaxID=390850 RepID=A0ACB1B0I5_MELEN
MHHPSQPMYYPPYMHHMQSFMPTQQGLMPHQQLPPHQQGENYLKKFSV